MANETIADIIAEMKREAAKIFPALPIAVLKLATRIEAACLEAAWKRELLTKPAENVNSGAASDTAGNCAKLREALKLFVEESELVCRIGMFNRNRLVEITTKARAALDAPPRNCDIYTTEDAVDTATVTVRDECDACPSLDMEAPCVFCMVRWLLAPATEQEGGAK